MRHAADQEVRSLLTASRRPKYLGTGLSFEVIENIYRKNETAPIGDIIGGRKLKSVVDSCQG